MGELKPSAQRVQDVIQALGYDFEVIEFESTTRTSADAAAAAGCTLGQIAKTLVFRAKTSDKPIIVITSGINRVDEKRVKQIIDEKIGRADAEFVREHTSFAIGGVPAVGFPQPIQILIDEDLMQYDEIWSAAGTPNAIYNLSPQQLVEMTRGIVGEIKKG